MAYDPPFQISSSMLNQVAEISEQIGRLANQPSALTLRGINHIRSVQGSLAIGAGINAGISAGINLTELDHAILELVATNPYISGARMAEQLGKSPSTIERRLQRLKKSRVAERIGARKTGYWQILYEKDKR